MVSSNENHPQVRRLPLPGSERLAVAGAACTGPADPNEAIRVTLLLRRSSEKKGVLAQLEAAEEYPILLKHHVSREEFAAIHGTDPEDLKMVEEFAEEYGLTVEKVNVAAGTVLLAGTTSAFSRSFGVELNSHRHGKSVFRGRTGHILLPEKLDGVVEAVLGLDNRPQTVSYHQLQQTPAAAAASRVSYTPPEVAKLYHFPEGVDCSGQCIGIIELGGGYRSEDMMAYFDALGIPRPRIADISIQGAGNEPTGDASGPDGEVALDIEVAAAVAPGVKIAVYFAPNTDSGFIDAIATAVHDTENKPSVISISWGAPEKMWTLQAMKAMNRALQDAAALGVTVCCASGDNGSTDGLTDGTVHVDFPASSPYALGCGGTKLIGSGDSITRETVWNEGMRGGATGGGVSRVFVRPTWQAGIKMLSSPHSRSKGGRGVPDVAGNADPATGYEVLVDSQSMVIGGTSAVAPLWAGLIAILNQMNGRPLGYLNPVLYGLPRSSGAFRDIVSGNNDIGGTTGEYPAHTGWDPCTGLGSPDGVKLQTALSGSSPSQQD